MDIVKVTTYILLSITSQAVYQVGECNGIYYPPLIMKTYALDVCTMHNTTTGVKSTKIECVDNDIKTSFFYSNRDCSGDPDHQSNSGWPDYNVCDANVNCPYAIIRAYIPGYPDISHCDDKSHWNDEAFLTNICQLSTNSSDNIGSQMLTCDENIGFIRESFPDETCTGEAIETDILYPINQCIQSDRDHFGGAMVTLQSCNDRSDTYTTARNRIQSQTKIDTGLLSRNIEVTAVATFTSYSSGIDGTVKVDENGNVFINLDVSNLDDAYDDCVFEYRIHNKWNYDEDDMMDKSGQNECILDMIGDVYNPFSSAGCNEENIEGDMYFECAIGDLSSRFGVTEYDENNKIVIEGNVSENVDDKESGFCNSRLTPQSLYQRSMVLYCRSDKTRQLELFCAPFQIETKRVNG